MTELNLRGTVDLSSVALQGTLSEVEPINLLFSIKLHTVELDRHDQSF